MFFVSKEARGEVMKLYQPLNGMAGTGAIWMDVLKDILCVVGGRCLKDLGTELGEMPGEMRAGLGRLAIDEKLLKKWATMKDDLLRLPALAELYVGEYVKFWRPNLIGGFEVVADEERATRKIKIIPSYDTWKLDEIKDSHPRWIPPSIVVGAFIREFLDAEQMEDEAEEETNWDGHSANPFADDPTNDPFSEHYVPRPGNSDDGEADLYNDPTSAPIYYHG